MEYNTRAAALKFEVINDCNDIGNWEIAFEEEKGIEEEKGNGFIELLIKLQRLPEDKINVIYVKNLNYFEVIGENFITYPGKFAANGNLEFYQLYLTETIQLREWNCFLEKEENPVNFVKKLDLLRNVFKKGRKEKLNLERHYDYTLARDMWADITFDNYLNTNWAKAYRNSLAPNSWEELNLLLKVNKGGFFMNNPKYKGDLVENVYSYDSSSSHIALMARKRFPSEAFKKEESLKEIVNAMKSNEAWIGEFAFSGLEQKVELPINLADFGVYLREIDHNVLVLNEVDFEWFKKVFKWNRIEYVDNFYHCPKRYLGNVNKNIYEMISKLYNSKESQKKGTFARDIYKFRAELPFGQSIKKPFYNEEVVYNEENNTFAVQQKKNEFKEIRRKLVSRYGLPYQIGLWTVAYSRLELINLILRIGVENVIYADTDCVKFIGEENCKILEEYNKEIDQEFKQVESKFYFIFGDKIGRWKFEGKADKFKALGVKWYLTEIEGKLDVKACGANKDILLAALNKSEDAFDMFDENLNIKGLFKNVYIDRVKKSVRITYTDKMGSQLKRELEIVSLGTIAMRRRNQNG